MVKAFADRLMEICSRDSEHMAAHWHKNLVENPRIPSYKSIASETCQRQASFIFKNLSKMYFSDNCYQTVMHQLDIVGLAEDNFSRGIPLEEVIYAIVLMRREIWLHTEQQALYNPEDTAELIQSINRVLLLFDYAIHVVISRYRKISNNTINLLEKRIS